MIGLKQILNLSPRGMISRHALETGVEGKARTFSVLSHFSAMLFAQLSHAIGLNDVCDWLRLKSAALSRFGVTAPARNTLSNANKERSADFCSVTRFSRDYRHGDFSHCGRGTSNFPRGIGRGTAVPSRGNPA